MRTAKYVITVATRSSSECPASDRTASEPVAMPTTPLAMVRPADATIDPRATFSFSVDMFTGHVRRPFGPLRGAGYRVGIGPSMRDIPWLIRGQQAPKGARVTPRQYWL